MAAGKHIDRICIIAMILALVLTILFMNGEKLGIEKIIDEDAELYSDLANFTANDQNGAWESEDATIITLNGNSAAVSGTGAYAYNGSVVISNAGYYEVSGTLTNGYISVDAYDSSKVWIKLNGVNINCEDNAAIRVEQADKVFLTLAEGNENYLTSGSEFSEAALADGTGGAVFAHDDLTINGSGSLTIVSGYKHGIDANDDLIITGGTISVTAPGDGLHANDSLRIMNAEITVDAEDDGFAVTNEGGYLVIESGTINITSADDGVHTTGDITISGGTLNISAGDDGIHSDTNVLISDGVVLISECYEGIEALTIDIAGGDITIYPTDDGLNANGGSDSFGMMGVGFGRGGWGQSTQTVTETVIPAVTETTDAEDDSTWIHISGGTLTIINSDGRDADGIDTNGDLIVTGGTIRVSLPGGGSNNAIDYGSESGGKATISGGNLAAAGGAQMAENFDAGSEQPVIMYNLTETVAGGTEVLVLDGDGNEILSYTPPQTFNSIFLSCPEMMVGETYTVVIGETEETLTLESDAVTLGSAGMGMMGGGFGRGGNRFSPTATAEGEEGVMSSSDGMMAPGGMAQDGEMTESDGTSTPDLMTPPDGEMPEFDGTMMPQDVMRGGPGGMMPPDGQMPEFDGTSMPGLMMPPDGTMPDFGGTMTPGIGMQGRGGGMRPDGMNGNMGPGFDQHQETEEPEETAVVSTGKSLSEFGKETWILLGCSAFVLLAALLIAKKFNH